MLNKLQLFNYQGQDVRTIWFEEKNDWWYILVDVCKILDLGNPARVADRLDPKGITLSKVPTNGGPQEMLCVDLPNYLWAIIRSDKPDAVKVQRWVCEEVLPAILKTGSYNMNGDINFQGYDDIKHISLEDKPELLRQAIQFYEDLILSCKEKRTFLRLIEKENFPNNYFTRGKRKTLDVNLYLRQVADRYQFGVKIVGQEIVTQRSFWGSDRAI